MDGKLGLVVDGGTAEGELLSDKGRRGLCLDDLENQPHNRQRARAGDCVEGERGCGFGDFLSSLAGFLSMLDDSLASRSASASIPVDPRIRTVPGSCRERRSSGCKLANRCSPSLVCGEGSQSVVTAGRCWSPVATCQCGYSVRAAGRRSQCQQQMPGPGLSDSGGW